MADHEVMEAKQNQDVGREFHQCVSLLDFMRWVLRWYGCSYSNTLVLFKVPLARWGEAVEALGEAVDPCRPEEIGGSYWSVNPLEPSVQVALYAQPVGTRDVAMVLLNRSREKMVTLAWQPPATKAGEPSGVQGV